MLTWSVLLRVVAAVLFVIASICIFFGWTSVADAIGIACVGLAAWVTSTFVPRPGRAVVA